MTIAIGIGIGITQQRKYNPFVLDNLTVSPLYAYSVRKLRGLYAGACLRVRRSSDNAEADIGFTSSGDLDQVALLAFVGANSGFVAAWYDQSGNGINAVQASAVLQTRIVNSGVIDTVGARPCLEYLGTQYNTIATTRRAFTGCYTSNVFRRTSGSGFLFSFRDLGNIGLIDDASTSGFGSRVRNDASALSSVTATQTTSQTVGGFGWNSTNSLVSVALNGVSSNAAGPSGTATIDRAALGASAFAYTSLFTGKHQEFIFFDSNLSTADRRNLEQNQGAYYGVSIA